MERIVQRDGNGVQRASSIVQDASVIVQRKRVNSSYLHVIMYIILLYTDFTSFTFFAGSNYFSFHHLMVGRDDERLCEPG